MFSKNPELIIYDPVKRKIRIFFFSSCLVLFLNTFSSAQFLNRLNVSLGYGFYEGFHAGLSFKLKDSNQSAGISIGAGNVFDFSQKYYSASVNYTRPVFKNKLTVGGYPKWQFDNTLVLWQMEDSYYIWRVISFIPSISRHIYLSDNLTLALSTGPSFNLVLYNKRKTFEKAGWPYHIYPNLKIQLIF